jgi:hypothetical protein
MQTKLRWLIFMFEPEPIQRIVEPEATERISDPEAIERIGVQAEASWEEDGVPAIVAGVVYSIVAGSILTLCSTMINTSPAWGWLTVSLLVLWLPGAFIFTNWYWQNREDICEWIKARITYSRTGYVAPPSYWTRETSVNNQVLFWIMDWMERHPRYERASQRIATLFFYVFLVAKLGATFHVSARLESVISYFWIVVGVGFLPSLVKHYLIKLKKNQLYWIEIIGVPVFLLAIILLWQKHRMLNSTLLVLAPGIYMILKGALFLVRYFYLYRVSQR